MTKIAHRSGPTLYPEQTVRSALHALENGADFVEIDLRFTADGQIAVCHDSNAERIFGIDKNICEMTAEEFLALRHSDAPDYKAHLFEDYIGANVRPLLLHIKEGGEKLDTILKTISENDYGDDCILGVSSLEDVKRIKKFDKNIKVLAFMKNKKCCGDFCSSDADYIRLWEGWTDRFTVRKIKKAGKIPVVMTGNTKGRETGIASKKDIRKLMRKGVDAFLTNDVTVLNEIG